MRIFNSVILIGKGGGKIDMKIFNSVILTGKESEMLM